ncbi:ABC transporter substrate-binding protein [Actinopolymorpha pittospori]|uniref:Peptide/nickel transport system substrate-binding protein n=1 Tax=Actinopolymorpha pittospori TaxID=648752 RepID=A0A927NCV8_9ACTN|nr:peptide/nickel transport system substrate-binding protein [Actinopolymorpha pittospori]
MEGQRGARVVDRRSLLRAGGLVAATLAASSACDFVSIDPLGDTASDIDESAAQGPEAPALAARVGRGELPPLAQRLPANPMVVTPVERAGVYGGVWRTGLLGRADSSWLTRTLGYENLLRWKPDWSGVVPNVAESYDVNDEGTEFTFTLRKGMRWSDGSSFTADDIVFAYNDVLGNEELSTTRPVFFSDKGGFATVTKLDAQTVRFTFSQPNGLFLQRLATPDGAALTMYPFEYLRRFHKKHNPDVDSLVRESGAKDWVELFESHGGSSSTLWTTVHPVLFAWVITTPIGQGSRVIAERNPYYWKVDTQGRQLPYLDGVTYSVVPDVELLTLKTLNGEIDMMDRNIGTLNNKPIFAKKRRSGGYHFYDTRQAYMNSAVIALNLTHDDPVKREIFTNKDFRIGLSYAIDRKEIIDVIYLGVGEPYQVGPRPDSPYYNERLARQYLDYDVAKANQHLDRAGYPRRDSDGRRIGPDGNPIFFVVEATISGEGPEWVDLMELVKDYWAAVGVQTRVRNLDRSILDDRRDANKQDASVSLGFGGGFDVLLDPRWFFPYNSSDNAYRWVQWYQSEGEEGTEPPAAAQRQQQLYEQIKTTIDPQRQQDLMAELLEISAEEFYAMGIAMRQGAYGIQRNNFHNVPPVVFDAWQYPSPAPTNPCQYFMTKA